MRLFSTLGVSTLLIAALAAPGLHAQFGPADGQDLPPADLNRVQAGQTAPDFTLPTPGGAGLTLSSLEGKNVVLVFYRGYW